MNKQAYLLGYKAASLSKEEFRKAAFEVAYSSSDMDMEKKAFIGNLASQAGKALGSWGGQVVDGTKSLMNKGLNAGWNMAKEHIPGVQTASNAYNMMSNVGGFMKKNWMPLMFGGLALGGGALALMGGRKNNTNNGKDNNGVQTYAGPTPPQHQGNWQTYNAQQMYGNQ